MTQFRIKQIRGASQGSILFLGTNSVVSEQYNNLRWEPSFNKLYIDGSIQLVDGNQQNGYILVSDSQGVAGWQQFLFASQSLVEVPISGTQNGINRDFVLNNFITSPVSLFFINGQLVNSGFDYTISGTALSIDPDRSAPTTTDILKIYGAISSFDMAGTSGTSGTSGTGVSGTSGTSGTSGQNGSSGTSGTSGTGFNTISNTGNNRLLTSDGTNDSANAESNLTFDGVTLNVNANLFVNGTFSISGSSSTIDTTTLVVADPIIALGHSQSGSPTLDEGFMFVRGTGLTQAFIWDESEDTFAIISTDDDHTVVGNININGYSNLRVGGLTTSQIRITDGAQSNYILVSDSLGNASWTASSFASISSVGDNRILTSDGSSNAVAESNLTFDGLTMSVSGDLSLTGTFSSNSNQISSDALTQAVLLYLSNNF